MKLSTLTHELAIWGYAFGYFACYAPYSALTKLLSQGKLSGMPRALSGFELLPITTVASLVAMFTFMTVMGFWQYAGRRTVFGRSVPFPGRWTFFSGLATAAVIGTTTLAYTFEGVSIVFMMLLMRGGMLVMAPIVDAISRRAVKWFSWVALALSLGALVAAFTDAKSYAMTTIAAVDVTVYLVAYFVRLRFMSRNAKSDRPEDSLKYFVEEQMVATPAIVTALIVVALVGHGSIGMDVRRGFSDIWQSGAVGTAAIVGVLSQGTGVFGGLVLLDKRENTFCVPVNRASSVLAGLVATAALTVIAGATSPPTSELVGAGLILSAIGVLATPTIWKAVRGKKAQPA
ncbi:MAG: hypothetical protein IPK82_43710 [Polyangiaceae bacterium]|nr:hypothetical protein [Polyangiaceae bacterium]